MARCPSHSRGLAPLGDQPGVRSTAPDRARRTVATSATSAACGAGGRSEHRSGQQRCGGPDTRHRISTRRHGDARRCGDERQRHQYTFITATTPLHSGATADVVVTNPDGLSATLTAGYTYDVVSLSVSSNVVTAGSAMTVSWVAPGPRSAWDWVGLFKLETRIGFTAGTSIRRAQLPARRAHRSQPARSL